MSNTEDLDFFGDNHFSSSYDTPIRKDAFKLSDDEKIEKIQVHFKEIMEILGLDLTDDSLKGTPKRVAKMYVKEIFSGLNPANMPNVATFDNKYKYNQMLVEKDISVYSTCEHHFLPIVGKAHVAYISSGNVVGLSKINRIVNHYAKRPQVQERLTMQIVKSLQKFLKTEDVACVIEAKHLCVNSRGVQDVKSSTTTAELGGVFKTDDITRKEFLKYITFKSDLGI
ncbi:MAG: GTP cyclohydrolase I FolE [Solirubrobacteraceae bacterium]